MTSTLSLFLKPHRHIGVRAEPHLLAFNLGNQAERDEVMMPLVRTLPGIGLGQLDAIAVHMIDCADMHAVGADDFHMLADLAGVGHSETPLLVSRAQRATWRQDAKG